MLQGFDQAVSFSDAGVHLGAGVREQLQHLDNFIAEHVFEQPGLSHFGQCDLTLPDASLAGRYAASQPRAVSVSSA